MCISFLRNRSDDMLITVAVSRTAQASSLWSDNGTGSSKTARRAALSRSWQWTARCCKSSEQKIIMSADSTTAGVEAESGRNCEEDCGTDGLFMREISGNK
jgi:hypothetical protein